MANTSMGAGLEADRTAGSVEPSPGTGTNIVTGAAMSPLPLDAHVLQPIIDRAHADPSRIVASSGGPDSAESAVTAEDFLRRVRSLAKGLIAAEIMPGDRVAIMSHTRVEWMLLDYAIVAVGAITVPVYETSSAEQIRWILANSGAVLAVVETPGMREMIEGLDIGDSEVAIRTIDEGAVDELVTQGRATTDAALDERIDAVTIEDIATIVYTSGTTGLPKGCPLTHGNLRANTMQSLDAVSQLLGTEERSLVFLPLAHSFAKIIALVGFEHGIENVFTSDIANLSNELESTRPTMVVAVPRVFEKVFSAAQQQSRARRLGRVFDRAADIAIRFSRQRAGGRVDVRTRIEHAIYDRLVYRQIRAALGGSLRFAFSGGSPLGERLTYFFDGVGVRIFEGYGLTETSPTLTVNRADAWRPGTVGAPLAGTALRIADDGEILATGPQVFSGYWRAPDATRETFTDDGWFRTGDIGQIEDGFLRITGRKKDLIVTAGGKNVAPTPIEDQLRAHPLISQAVVVGDNRPFISALITIDADAFELWRSGEGPQRSIADSVDDPDLRAEIQRSVDDANESLSRAESIRKFTILPSDFEIAAGELTPTLKIRRSTVMDNHTDAVERLYS